MPDERRPPDDSLEQLQALQARARYVAEVGRGDRAAGIDAAEANRRSTHHIAAGWANGRPLIQALGGKPYALGRYITNASVPRGSSVQLLGRGVRLGQMSRRRRVVVEEIPIIITPWWYEIFGGALVEPAGTLGLFSFAMEPPYLFGAGEYNPPNILYGSLCWQGEIVGPINATISGDPISHFASHEGCHIYFHILVGIDKEGLPAYLDIWKGREFYYQSPFLSYPPPPTAASKYAGLSAAKIFPTQAGLLKMQGTFTKPAASPMAAFRLAVFELLPGSPAFNCQSLEDLRSLILNQYLAQGGVDPTLAAKLVSDPLTRFRFLNTLIEMAWISSIATFEGIGLRAVRLFGFDAIGGAGTYAFTLGELVVGEGLESCLTITKDGVLATMPKYARYAPNSSNVINVAAALAGGNEFFPINNLDRKNYLVFAFTQAAVEPEQAIAFSTELIIGF